MENNNNSILTLVIAVVISFVVLLNLASTIEFSAQDTIALGLILLCTSLVAFIIFFVRRSSRKLRRLQSALSGRESHIKEILSYQNELRQQKETTQDSYTQLERLIENTAVGIWDWHIESDDRKSNERCAQILGYTTANIDADKGQAWLDKIHPDDLDRVKTELNKHYRKIIDRYCLEIRMLHKEGHWVWILDAGKVIERDSNLRPIRMIGTYSDITERVIAVEKLSFQASHDSLTGLYNRIEFENQLKQAIKPNAITKDNILLFLDLDQFKIVNDTGGHSAGDELLRQIPELIRKNCRESDILARMGGDEFGLILYGCHMQKAEIIAQEIIDSISNYHFIWGDQLFKIGVSIGMVSLNTQTFRVEEALHYADTACFSAKDAGRNCYSIYTVDKIPSTEIIHNYDWLPKIEHALKFNLFEIYAQPVVTLDETQSINSYELLIRMKSDIGPITLPKMFFPAAERHNKLQEIDQWLIHETLLKLRGKHHVLHKMGIISINISSQSLTSEGFINYILDETTRNPEIFKHICFEITEHTLITHLALATKNINRLRNKGISFAIDDFGNSLSSFRYLRKLPIDYLKIDGQLINNIQHDKLDFELLKSISTMSKLLNLRMVAKLIEDQKTIQILTDMGIDCGQSHLLGEPLPIDKVINHMSSELNHFLDHDLSRVSKFK